MFCHYFSLGLEWKLTFSSPVTTAEFSKFPGILSATLSHHYLLGLYMYSCIDIHICISDSFCCMARTNTALWLPWWFRSKEFACDTEDAGAVDSIPGSGRSLGGGHGNLLQYSWLEHSMDRGAWQAMGHEVSKSQTSLEWLSMHNTALKSNYSPIKKTEKITYICA